MAVCASMEACSWHPGQCPEEALRWAGWHGWGGVSALHAPFWKHWSWPLMTGTPGSAPKAYTTIHTASDAPPDLVGDKVLPGSFLIQDITRPSPFSVVGRQGGVLLQALCQDLNLHTLKIGGMRRQPKSLPLLPWGKGERASSWRGVMTHTIQGANGAPRKRCLAP